MENKFNKLLEFIQTLRAALEYGESNIRKNDESYRSTTNELIARRGSSEHRHNEVKSICWLHPSMTNHSITDCFTFASKNNQETVDLVREKAACWSCLAIGHIGMNCVKKTVCNIDSCTSHHHHLLHPAHVEGIVFYNEIIERKNTVLNPCLLLIMQAPARSEKQEDSRKVNVMWDSAPTISLITHNA